MTDDLFSNLPIVKSPRLLWMEANHITTTRKCNSIGMVYVATRKGLGYRTIETKAGSEHDALVALAIKLNIKLWNE